MSYKKLSFLTVIAATLFIFMTTTGTAYATEAAKISNMQDSTTYAEVVTVVDKYVAALQKGSSAELKTIFLPEANYYFFHEGKLMGGGIEILYKAVDATPIPKPIVYDVVSVEVSGRIASVTLDIRDLMGVHVIDMFTLVQDDNKAWKMASKVARRQS